MSAAYGSEVTLEEAVAALGLTTDTRALDVARAALRRDLRAGLQALAGAQADAVDLGRFNRQVVKYLRHALLLQSGATDQLALSEPETQALQALVQDVDPAATVAALRAFSSADLHSDPYAALPLELALAQLAFEADSIASAALTSAPVARCPSPKPSSPAGRRHPAPAASRSGRRAPPPREAPRPPPPVRAAPAPPSASVEAAAVAPAGAQAGGRDPSPEDETLRAIRLGLKERGQHQLAAFLNKSCRILSLEGDILTLGFFPVYLDIHKSKVEESVSTVAAAASAVIGRPISIVCTADDGAPPARSPLVAEAERMGARVSASGPASRTGDREIEDRVAKAKGGMFRQPKRSARGAAAGGGGFSPDMVRQAQALQTQLAQAQEELSRRRWRWRSAVGWSRW